MKEVAATQREVLAQRRRESGWQRPRVRPAAAGRRRTRLAWSTVALAGAVAVVLMLVMRPGEAPSLTFRSSAGQGTLGRAYRDAVVFSDGSQLAPAAGAAVDVVKVGPAGAEVRIDGTVEVDIHHRDETSWRVLGGPYAVVVTGTRFRVQWSATEATFALTMREGAVRVEGPDERTLAVAAGQSLAIRGSSWRVGPAEQPPGDRADGTDVTAPAAAASRAAEATSAAGGASLPSAAPEPTIPAGASAAASWESLARAGDFAGAYRLARPRWQQLCGRAPGDELLLLGDTARFARDADRADIAYGRASAHREIAERALFARGLVALDLRADAGAAVTWFGRALRAFPRGRLAADASGRLLELALARGDRVAAAREARRYLGLAPDGPHAGEARRLLSEAGDRR